MFETEIKEALKKAGLSEGLWKRINIAKAEEAEGAVENLKKELDELGKATGADFTKKLAEFGLDSAVKSELQKEGDRRATQAIDTYKKKNPDKKDDDDDEDDTKKKKEPDLKGDTPLEKAMISMAGQITKMSQTIEKLEQRESKTDKTTQARGLLKEAGMPEDYVKYIDLESEVSISDQVENVKKDFAGFAQSKIDKAVKDEELLKPGGKKDFSEEAVKEFAQRKSKKQDSKGLETAVGKEIETINT
ncbi:MAG TPA: hypothetical protein VMW32_05735 [Bacteroidales bacterium]|nr:hypothetical protein [Bacteroidales bacterium]